MLKKLFFFLVGIFVLVVAGLFVLHWYANQGFLQKTFVKGKVPDIKPNGFYKGEVESFNLKTPWLGKEFDRKKKTGINVFESKGKKFNQYSFKTYEAKGETDKNLNVLKVDYNISQNPLWLRPLVDELVITATDTYVGKIQLRVLAGKSFTLGFFSLEK